MDMRMKISNFLADKLYKRTGCNKQMVTYALWNIFSMIMLLSIFYIAKRAITNLFNITIPIFILYGAFYLLRIFLGGFHLQNTNLCIVLTIIIIIITSVISYYLAINLLILLLAYATYFIIVYTIGVIDNDKKRFSQQRKLRYRKIGLILLVVLLSINLFFYFIDWNQISNAIVMGVTLECINLVYAYVIKSH